MATKRRSQIKDGVLFFPGLSIFADTVTLTGGKVLSVSFPAKTVLAVLTSTAEDTDAAKVASTWSITNNVATVTFTKTGTGVFSYIILSTVTETQTSPETVTDNLTETPIP